MRNFLLAWMLFQLAAFNSMAQGEEEKAILQILTNQTLSWNSNDLDNFMKGYWNHDSLVFVGKNGVTYGYKNILNNYKKNYSDADKRGQLSFDILQVKKLSSEYYAVIGKWMLTRHAGDISGHYTLLFKKINGNWKIISDHSS